MEKMQTSSLSNIQIAENFQKKSTNLYWQGSKIITNSQEADNPLNAENLWASFGAPMIITKDAHLKPMQLIKLSPFLTTQGITTAFVMLEHVPSAEQLVADARLLKGKISTHTGWILPLSEYLSPSEIQQLENAPAVCGWYCDDAFINEGKFTNLASISKPLLIHAPDASVKNFCLLQKMLLAMNKQGFITALNHNAPSILTWLGINPEKNSYCLSFIVSDRPHLIENFWKSWSKQHQQQINEKTLCLLNEYIAQSYQILNIKNKGRLYAGYDADIVLIDERGDVQHVITHGEISLWKTEFTESYNGIAPKQF